MTASTPSGAPFLAALQSNVWAVVLTLEIVNAAPFQNASPLGVATTFGVAAVQVPASVASSTCEIVKANGRPAGHATGGLTGGGRGGGGQPFLSFFGEPSGQVGWQSSPLPLS